MRHSVIGLASLRAIFWVALLLSTSPPSEFAQEAKGKGSSASNLDDKVKKTFDRASESAATLRRKQSLDVIREAGTEASSIEDRWSSARIQVSAARALWGFDSETARKLFRSGFESARRFLRDGKDDPTASLTTVSQSARMNLCREIISTVRSLDSALARDLLSQLSADVGQSGGVGEGGADDTRAKVSFPSESYLYRGPGAGDDKAKKDVIDGIALLFDDQQAGILAAKKVMASSIEAQVVQLFWQLAARDREAADDLFLWLLDRIQRDENAGAGQLQIIAAYPFGGEIMYIADGLQPGWAGPSGTPRMIAKARASGNKGWLRQRFINTSFIVLSRTASSDLAGFPDAQSRIGGAAHLAQWLVPRVAQYNPILVAAWQDLTHQLFARLQSVQLSKLAQTALHQRSVTDKLFPTRQKTTKTGNELIEDLLERAKSSNAAQRDVLLREAALEAERADDVWRALDIVFRIADRDVRGEVRAWLYMNLALRALNGGRYDEASQYAQEVDVADQYAFVICKIVRAIIKKNKTHATEMLSAAEARVISSENAPAKVRALTLIAGLFASFEMERGFETMEETIRKVNDISSYGPDDDKIERALGRGGQYQVVETIESVNLNRTLEGFATMDFARTLQIAKSIERKPLKLSAMIAVAQMGLRQSKEPSAAAVAPSNWDK